MPIPRPRFTLRRHRFRFTVSRLMAAVAALAVAMSNRRSAA
jgi:hypothetical protein